MGVIYPRSLNRRFWLAEDLVAFWPLWEGAGSVVGDVVDPGRSGKHGTLTGMTSDAWVVTEKGSALDFPDVTTKYVNFGKSILPAAAPRPCTLLCYCILDVVQDYHPLFTNNFPANGPRLYFEVQASGSDHIMRLYSGGSGWSNTLGTVVGEPAHFAVTWDTDDAIAFFYNGSPAGTDSRTLGGDTDDGAALGTLNGTSSAYALDGRMLSFLVYNRVLSAAEIRALYDESTANYPNLFHRGRRSVYAAAVVGGLSIPVAMHHYTKNIRAA